MPLSGYNLKLFHALSAITAWAYKDNRLLSCAVLSKAPNYGNVLDNFINNTPIKRPSFFIICFSLIRYLLVNIGEFCYFLTVKLLWQWHCRSKPFRPFAEKKQFIILDVFALLPNIVKRGSFHDLYLPGIARQAQSLDLYPLYLYRLYGSRSFKVTYRALQILGKERVGIPDICLLTITDWFRLFAHIVMYVISLRSLICQLEKECRLKPSSNTYTPEAYILQALYETIGANILSGELARLVGKRLTEKLSCSEGNIVISWYENQTINKAFYRGVSESRKVLASSSPSKMLSKFIGAQLLLWPEALLNNHPDDGEAALGLVPDKVVVNGSWFLPQQTTQKYEVGPALRYKKVFSHFGKTNSHYSKDRNNEIVAPKLFKNSNNELVDDNEKSLLVLLSYHPEEIKRTLQTVLPLAKKGIKLTYKFHPATKVSSYKQWLPESPILSEDDLYNVSEKSYAVIGSGSGALAEAVAIGVPALTVDLGKGLTLNYLPDYGQGFLWEKIKNADEVELVLDKLRSNIKREEYVNHVHVFRDMLFSEPTDALIVKAFELNTR